MRITPDDLIREVAIRNRVEEAALQDVAKPIMRNVSGYPTSSMPITSSSFTSAMSSIMPYYNGTSAIYGSFPIGMYGEVAAEPRVIKPKAMKVKMKPIALEPKRRFTFD